MNQYQIPLHPGLVDIIEGHRGVLYQAIVAQAHADVPRILQDMLVVALQRMNGAFLRGIDSMYPALKDQVWAAYVSGGTPPAPGPESEAIRNLHRAAFQAMQSVLNGSAPVVPAVPLSKAPMPAAVTATAMEPKAEETKPKRESKAKAKRPRAEKQEPATESQQTEAAENSTVPPEASTTA